MKEQDDNPELKYTLRIRKQLRDRAAAVGRKNRRSLHSEILEAIERHVESEEKRESAP